MVFPSSWFGLVEIASKFLLNRTGEDKKLNADKLYFEGDIVLKNNRIPYKNGEKKAIKSKREVTVETAASEDDEMVTTKPATNETATDGAEIIEATTINPTTTESLITPTSASEGYKERTDLWPGGKVPFKYETDMSEFTAHTNLHH